MPQDGLNRILEILYVSSGIGVVVSIIRKILEERHGNLSEWVKGVLSAVLVAGIIGWGLADSGLAQTLQYCIIGISAYVADDLRVGIGRIVKDVAANPLQILKDAINTWRGQK